MDEAARGESGTRRLGRFIQTTKLPYAQEFLDVIDLSAADRTALARAVDELYRPSALDSERALVVFKTTHSPGEQYSPYLIPTIEKRPAGTSAPRPKSCTGA